MNYSKIYNQLIERGQNRVIQGYSERHHIVPRCMGGTDDKSNLVALTPEEHFVAHVLLVKMYPNEKGLVYAVHRLAYSSMTGKMYGWLKRKAAEETSKRFKGKVSHKKGKPLSEATKKKMSLSKKGKPSHQVFSAETKLKMSKSHSGFKHSSESKRKMSETRKQSLLCFENIKKLSELNKGREPWNKGIPVSEETRKKMSGRIPWNKGLKHVS